MYQLLSQEKKLIATSPPIYNTSPFIVFSLYQDKYLLSWFRDHYREPFFYDNQICQLVKFVPDVTEYEPELIEAIMDLAIKKAAKSVVYAHLEKFLHRNELSSMGCEKKSIILILIKDDSNESS